MADQVTLPLELTLSATNGTAKRGSRHSSGDTQHLKAVRKHAKQLGQLGTAIIECCDALGVADEEETEESDQKNAPPAATASTAAPANTSNDAPIENLKTLPLDKLVGAVGDAVGKLNRSGYGYDSIPYEQWCQVAGVYEDFVVIREGLTHWKVGYTVGEKAIELAPRDQWEAVELDWSTKSAEPAADVEISEIKSAPVFHTMKAMGKGRLGHYAVLWGDDNKRDLYKEWFDQSTDELDVIFKAMGKLPALYQHAMDDTVKTSVVGVVDTMKADDIGLWVETQLNLADQYSQAIEQIAETGKLGTSTGTLPGARKVAKTGYIERWPIAEISLTPTPAEPRMRTQIPVAVIKAAYAELGLDFPDQIAQDTGAEEARQQAELELERERLALLQLTV